MADRTEELLPHFIQHRLPGLDLGREFVYPDYAGSSLLNLPSSICRWLGMGELGAPGLAPALLAPYLAPERQFNTVILVVIDALGLQSLRRQMAAGQLPSLQRLTDRGLLAPLASVVPSTTVSALTTLWSGRSPAEHGLTGYEMWMKEYGVVANTILHAPITFRQDTGSLVKAGFDPETYLPFPTLGEHLDVHGVHTSVFQHYSILNSGMSQMLFRKTQRRPFGQVSELWVNVRQELERRAGDRKYIYVYWGEVDTLGHRYGPDDERTLAELDGFTSSLERLLLDKIRPAALDNTLLLLTADHGQILTRKDPYYELGRHPSLTRRLHILPTGENRLAYLYPRPGQMEAVREYIERTWRGQFVLLESAYAMEQGLFGPGKPHPYLADRVGDLIAIARGDAYWWWSDKENRLAGRHGGLLPDEMLVPCLALAF